MRNKTVDLVLISIIILIFLAYFAFRYTQNNNDSLYNQLNIVEYNSRQGDWDEALKSSEGLKKLWKNQKLFVALNYAEEDFSTLETAINNIIGGIKAEDLATVLSNIEAAKDLWRNFNKVVPEP
jgi:cell division protein YceG involved in septum cleavage